MGLIFYIARCDHSGAQFLLQLTDDARTVTDLAPFSGPLPHLRSVNGPPAALTAEHLRPCPVCGSRKVQGCRCLREHLPCEAHIGYRFGCIYCDRLRILGSLSRGK